MVYVCLCSTADLVCPWAGGTGGSPWLCLYLRCHGWVPHGALVRLTPAAWHRLHAEYLSATSSAGLMWGQTPWAVCHLAKAAPTDPTVNPPMDNAAPMGAEAVAKSNPSWLF